LLGEHKACIHRRASFGVAIRDALRQWEELTVFLDDATVPLPAVLPFQTLDAASENFSPAWFYVTR
jgi:hypothetical protein